MTSKLNSFPTRNSELLSLNLIVDDFLRNLNRPHLCYPHWVDTETVQIQMVAGGPNVNPDVDCTAADDRGNLGFNSVYSCRWWPKDDQRRRSRNKRCNV